MAVINVGSFPVIRAVEKEFSFTFFYVTVNNRISKYFSIIIRGPQMG